MEIELLNILDPKDLFSAYDFAALCIKITPNAGILAEKITANLLLDGEKLDEARTFTEDDAWLKRFIELDLEWTKLSETPPEPPYDVLEKLQNGEPIFLVLEPHMNFLDCLKDTSQTVFHYELEVEVIIDTPQSAVTVWGDWTLGNPWSD